MAKEHLDTQRLKIHNRICELKKALDELDNAVLGAASVITIKEKIHPCVFLSSVLKNRVTAYQIDVALSD